MDGKCWLLFLVMELDYIGVKKTHQPTVPAPSPSKLGNIDEDNDQTIKQRIGYWTFILIYACSHIAVCHRLRVWRRGRGKEQNERGRRRRGRRKNCEGDEKKTRKGKEEVNFS